MQRTDLYSIKLPEKEYRTPISLKEAKTKLSNCVTKFANLSPIYAMACDNSGYVRGTHTGHEVLAEQRRYMISYIAHEQQHKFDSDNVCLNASPNREVLIYNHLLKQTDVCYYTYQIRSAKDL